MQLQEADTELINSASEVIRLNYRNERHTVGAAVLASSGKIYIGVNIDSCGYGPCAEPIALGSAISNGERNFLVFVAVSGKTNKILQPCGNCRQMLLDYAPEAMVILDMETGLEKVFIKDLLPHPYNNLSQH